MRVVAEENELDVAGLEFEVAGPVQIGHEARRDSPSAVVYPTGRAPLNVGGTALLDQLAEQSGFKPHEYAVLLGANRAANVVSVRVVKPETPMAMTFRRSPDGREATLYLHGVFKDFPALRPAGRQTCQIMLSKDAKGVSCLIINLRGGFAKIKGQRTAAAKK